MMSNNFLKTSIKNEVMKKSASSAEKKIHRKTQSALPPTKSSGIEDNRNTSDSLLERKKRPEKAYSASNINKKKRFVYYFSFTIFDGIITHSYGFHKKMNFVLFKKSFNKFYKWLIKK